jgi:hypothetical protein
VGERDAADARQIVVCIERMPVTRKIRLEPGREIHRQIAGRHADIAEIASAVARRTIHRPAEPDREVRKVAADARCARDMVPSETFTRQ